MPALPVHLGVETWELGVERGAFGCSTIASFQNMAPARAAVYIGGAVVLAAWLAAAASTSLAPAATETPSRPTVTAGTERLAADMQKQAARLRQRLASAPVPQQPSRNPFAFAVRGAPRPRPAAVRGAIAQAPQFPATPPDPELALAGIAEQQSEHGVVRTAVIVGAGDEIYLVTPGQSVTGRYTVTAVGADAVELRDSVTGSTRRLALR